MKVKIEGFKELERALAEELPRATARNALRRAALNSMARIENRARQLAPKDEGDLASSIKTKNVRAKRQNGSVRFARAAGVEVATGPTGREEGGNAAWQEFGTVKAPAQPYMRPTADSEGEAVVREVRDELATQVNKAKARIARKMAKQGR